MGLLHPVSYRFPVITQYLSNYRLDKVMPLVNTIVLRFASVTGAYIDKLD